MVFVKFYMFCMWLYIVFIEVLYCLYQVLFGFDQVLYGCYKVLYGF